MIDGRTAGCLCGWLEWMVYCHLNWLLRMFQIYRTHAIIWLLRQCLCLPQSERERVLEPGAFSRRRHSERETPDCVCGLVRGALYQWTTDPTNTYTPLQRGERPMTHDPLFGFSSLTTLLIISARCSFVRSFAHKPTHTPIQMHYSSYTYTHLRTHTGNRIKTSLRAHPSIIV